MIQLHSYQISKECSPALFWTALNYAIETRQTIQNILRYTDHLGTKGALELLRFAHRIYRMNQGNYRDMTIVKCVVPDDVRFMGIWINYEN